MAKSLKREIRWTSTANQQYLNVLEYWNQRNKSTAFSIKLADLVTEHLKKISSHPFASKASKYPDTRVTSLGHYSIYYKVFDSQILLTAFWDNRRDPKKLLKTLGND